MSTGASFHWLGPVVLCELADVAALLSDADAAAEILGMLERHRGLVALPPTGVFCLGGVDRHLGQLRAVLGDSEQALRLMRSSALVEQRLGAGACRARTLAWMTTLAETTGVVDAGPVHGECEELIEGHGLHGIAHRAQSQYMGMGTWR